MCDSAGGNVFWGSWVDWIRAWLVRAVVIMGLEEVVLHICVLLFMAKECMGLGSWGPKEEVDVSERSRSTSRLDVL